MVVFLHRVLVATNFVEGSVLLRFRFASGGEQRAKADKRQSGGNDSSQKRVF